LTKELKVWLSLTLLGILLALCLKYFFNLMAPFLFGIVFACLSEPIICQTINKLKVTRGFAVTLVLLGVSLLFGVITLLAVLTLYQEIQRLVLIIPSITLKIKGLIIFWQTSLTMNFPLFKKNIDLFSYNPESITKLFRSLIQGVLYFLGCLPQLLVAIGLGGVSAYFFSRDREELSHQYSQLLPSKWRGIANQVKTEVLVTSANFIRVECLLVIITASLTTLIFWLLGIPGYIAYGYLAGILDFLPVLGPGLLYLPLFFGYLLFQEYSLALLVFFSYFLVLLVRQLVEIRLIGVNLNLHPLLALFLIYAGMSFFGLAGILLSPFLVIILRAVYRTLMVKGVFS